MDMNTINDRFNELIKALKLNPSSFARSIGKSYNAVESIVKSKTRPSYDVLEAVFQSYPDLNPSWLMTGKGEMLQAFANVSADNGGENLEKELRERIKSQSETIQDLRYTVELQKQIIGKQGLGKFKGTPIYGQYAPLLSVPQNGWLLR